MRTELNTNKIFYQGFCQDNIDILEEFEKYLKDPLENYGKDSIDLLLNALGNAYKLGIIIFQSNSEQCWLVNQADNMNQFTETLYFVRTESLHVDPVIPKDHDSDSDLEIVNVVDKKQDQNSFRKYNIRRQHL